MLLGLFGRREGPFLDITTGLMSPGKSHVTTWSRDFVVSTSTSTNRPNITTTTSTRPRQHNQDNHDNNHNHNHNHNGHDERNDKEDNNGKKRW